MYIWHLCHKLCGTWSLPQPNTSRQTCCLKFVMLLILTLYRFILILFGCEDVARAWQATSKVVWATKSLSRWWQALLAILSSYSTVAKPYDVIIILCFLDKRLKRKVVWAGNGWWQALLSKVSTPLRGREWGNNCCPLAMTYVRLGRRYHNFYNSLVHHVEQVKLIRKSLPMGNEFIKVPVLNCHHI